MKQVSRSDERSQEVQSLGFRFTGYVLTGTGIRIAYFTHPHSKDSAEVILGLFGDRLDGHCLIN